MLSGEEKLSQLLKRGIEQLIELPPVQKPDRIILTKEEIASIKSLELELDGLGISMDELRIKQDNTSEQAAEYNEQILSR